MEDTETRTIFICRECGFSTFKKEERDFHDLLPTFHPVMDEVPWDSLDVEICSIEDGDDDL